MVCTSNATFSCGLSAPSTATWRSAIRSSEKIGERRRALFGSGDVPRTAGPRAAWSKIQDNESESLAKDIDREHLVLVMCQERRVQGHFFFLADLLSVRGIGCREELDRRYTHENIEWIQISRDCELTSRHWCLCDRLLHVVRFPIFNLKVQSILRRCVTGAWRLSAGCVFSDCYHVVFLQNSLHVSKQCEVSDIPIFVCSVWFHFGEGGEWRKQDLLQGLLEGWGLPRPRKVKGGSGGKEKLCISVLFRRNVVWYEDDQGSIERKNVSKAEKTSTRIDLFASVEQFWLLQCVERGGGHTQQIWWEA